MAESLFILELEFLHVRGGCSLVVVFFVLMLVGTCYPVLYIFLTHSFITDDDSRLSRND